MQQQSDNNNHTIINTQPIILALQIPWIQIKGIIANSYKESDLKKKSLNKPGFNW